MFTPTLKKIAWYTKNLPYYRIFWKLTIWSQVGILKRHRFPKLHNKNNSQKSNLGIRCTAQNRQKLPRLRKILRICFQQDVSEKTGNSG